MSFPLAEAETQLTMMRQLCYLRALTADRRPAHTAEAAMCKWYVPKVACEIIHQCLLTHGHYGYTTDLPFHQRYLDVMGLQIGDGTATSLYLFLLENPQARDAFNGTAPQPVTMKEFAKALGRALHRPAIFPVPAPILRLALGEVADILLTGQYVEPRRTREAGFGFQFSNVDGALGDVVHSKSA